MTVPAADSVMKHCTELYWVFICCRSVQQAIAVVVDLVLNRQCLADIFPNMLFDYIGKLADVRRSLFLMRHLSSPALESSRPSLSQSQSPLHSPHQHAARRRGPDRL